MRGRNLHGCARGNERLMVVRRAACVSKCGREKEGTRRRGRGIDKNLKASILEAQCADRHAQRFAECLGTWCRRTYPSALAIPEGREDVQPRQLRHGRPCLPQASFLILADFRSFVCAKIQHLATQAPTRTRTSRRLYEKTPATRNLQTAVLTCFRAALAP